VIVTVSCISGLLFGAITQLHIIMAVSTIG